MNLRTQIGAGEASATATDDWWRSAVVYQIYPRSFADANGDGIGDLPGVIEHLDYIADLGVDVIWLSPIYASPHDDNGYDISDYQAIDPVFGTLDDFDRLVEEAHSRGLKIVMDLVVNHTSDEHPWFIESRSSRTGPKADWYIWRDPGEGGAPNNWGSFFSGSAWEYETARDQYYLHLFSRKQPDLNWDNPEMRNAVYAMMGWWLDRGVDGFRMDVINFISKDPALPDGEVLPSGYGDGMPYFAYGPHVHDYLAEMQREVFASREGTYLTVGEMPGVTVEQARRFTDRRTGQLNMVFQFEHMDLDHVGGSKWDYRPTSLRSLKDSLGRWQTGLGADGWNSLYWNNHDQPRVVSRFGDDQSLWYESATALATILHLHRGTPYVYQGEELGMTNVPFGSIEDFHDIETLNHYRSQLDSGADQARLEALLEVYRRKSRDNARTPMQWTAERNAGFSSVTPWMPLNPAYARINAEGQVGDPRSIHAYYKRLIALRHSDPVVVHGDFTMLEPSDEQLYAFVRQLGEEMLLVAANCSAAPITRTLRVGAESAATVVLGNHDPVPPYTATLQLRPWEARVYRFGGGEAA